MMQTSSGYEYDVIYKGATPWDSWDTNGEQSERAITEETATQKLSKTCQLNKDGKKKLNAKTESREKKIKGLKALLRKQEKAIAKLKPDALQISQKQSSVATSEERTNRSNVAKRCRRKTLATKGRISRKKVEPCNNVPRDVDIWMGRGDLITKDEFLGVLGLVRVANFTNTQYV